MPIHDGRGSYMSDRSKKIIWIAVAVSGFTLVVFLMAFILFPPNAVSASKPFDLTGRSPGKAQSANDFSAFPSIVVQSSGNDSTTQSATSASADNSVVVIQAPTAPAANSSTSAGTSTGTSTRASAAPAATTTVPARSSASSSPKPAAQKPTTSPAPSAATPASTPASAPAPSATASKTTSSTGSEYWIQVGSFSEKATADKLQSEFESRGMTAIIVTKVIGSRNYYQVKVGPYASSNDAKKWIGTVKSVPGSSQDAFITTR